MMNKRMLALAVVLTISALGNGLTCYDCEYDSKMSKEKQKCGNTTVPNCSSEYCFSAAYTDSSGVYHVQRNCDTMNLCPDAKKSCEMQTTVNKLKSCAAVCCGTDKCNSYSPSDSAAGIMTAKFTLCSMILAAFLFGF